jgi:hypothetical protein
METHGFQVIPFTPSISIPSDKKQGNSCRNDYNGQVAAELTWLIINDLIKLVLAINRWGKPVYHTLNLMTTWT